MTELHFDVMSGLKRVLGRELITNDEVAVFELVKNSFDAAAKQVYLYFGENNIVIADDGRGMSYEDITNKWLSVAYSAKRNPENDRDFRALAAARGPFAGSKGIGRFSSDRLGSEIILQSRSEATPNKIVNRLTTFWARFEENDRERFENVPVDYEATATFELPLELSAFAKTLSNGTVLEIRDLRQKWDREVLKRLKSALAKLINPFGSGTDGFSIHIVAPAEEIEDQRAIAKAVSRSEEPSARDTVNGRVGNFIFSALREKTTFISVWIKDSHIYTNLTDRGELIYAIREPNDFDLLEGAELRCDIYYLNQSAKITFARRVGLPSVQFGNLFLFRNGFRVFPIGEQDDDWFGFTRRKQQGYNRFLGTREIIGRVDVSGAEDKFQEASSRNQGLIDTPAVRQLRDFVMDNCLRRLERYVVPVSWVDKGESLTDDISRLLTEPGKARVTAAVANLVDNESIELLDYSRELVSILNERSAEFESSIVSLRTIAEKVNDKALLSKVAEAEKRFDELKRAEAEARKAADEQREAAREAEARATAAESVAEEAKAEVETERRRSHFLESIVDLDAATILNLHHQVTIYSVNAAQQIENFLNDTARQKSIPRENVLKAFEQIAYLNAKVYAITRFAARAAFKLESEKITTDIAGFTTDYIEDIAKQFSSARMRIEVDNTHTGLEATFNPIDISILVDNLISNARKARANLITFELTPIGKTGLQISVSDNGRGIPASVDKSRIFEMGYTTTHGSGLGLYHVRQILGEMGGTIELAEAEKGTSFVLKIVPPKRKSE
ncbi:ATP-binding protein [Mesorhizobium sp. M0058]|uniref:ATP-binding protein n=1 Tax=Mesorhizobium sp. M0058 TaxID=2956865 RepID=UPI00333CD401